MLLIVLWFDFTTYVIVYPSLAPLKDIHIVNIGTRDKL